MDAVTETPQSPLSMGPIERRWIMSCDGPGAAIIITKNVNKPVLINEVIRDGPCSGHGARGGLGPIQGHKQAVGRVRRIHKALAEGTSLSIGIHFDLLWVPFCRGQAKAMSDLTVLKVSLSPRPETCKGLD